MSAVTVYVTVGNSDDKLSQVEWFEYVTTVDTLLREYGQRIHGEWYSAAASPWQNACWCVEVPAANIAVLKQHLKAQAQVFRQDSIAWAVAPTVEFLG